MSKKLRINIYLSQEALSNLRILASRFGYFHPRGPGANTVASISAMLEDLGRGILTITEGSSGTNAVPEDRQ